VKSKISGNFKSIAKAQARDKQSRAENDESPSPTKSPTKSSPMKNAMSFISNKISDKDFSGAIQGNNEAGSPRKFSANSPTKSPTRLNESTKRIQIIQQQIEAQERETANLRRELEIAREKAMSSCKKEDFSSKTFSTTNLAFKLLDDTVTRM
jgi:hypothetical protein